MPAVFYTDIAIATTGLTIEQATKQGLVAAKAQFPFAANGQAISMDSATGFVRLVFEKSSQALLGAQMVGPHVSDLISKLTLAIETGTTIDDLALTIHPHPSISEAVLDAADVGLGLPINI